MVSNHDLEQAPQANEESSEEPGTITPKINETISESSPFEDWTDHLDGNSIVEVLELNSDSLQWETVPLLSVFGDPLSSPKTARARLYLAEGLTKGVISFFSHIDRDFFHCHYLNALPYGRSRLDNQHFYGKWSRQVRQTPQQWIAEDRINKGRPWDLNIPIDPREVRSDHVRYEMSRSIRRPHGSLEAHVNDNFQRRLHVLEKTRRTAHKAMAKQREAGRLTKAETDLPDQGDFTMRRAVQESVSIYHRKYEDDRFVGLVLFDAPVRIQLQFETYFRGKVLRKQSFKPFFENFIPSRQRFKEQLQLAENSKPFMEAPATNIKEIMLRLMLDDQVQIMGDFREALDFIDENMSNDSILRDNLQDWRYLFGQWKRILSNDSSALAYTTQILDSPSHPPPKLVDAVHSPLGQLPRTDNTFRRPTQDDFDRLRRETKDLTERAALTFQAMTSTMSMVESQKSIVQAETISKLTKLAFFFIPLTLTASIFGMNITEWDHQLRTWIWVTVSLVVLLLTYGALYFEEMTIVLSNQKLNQFSVDDTAQDLGKLRLYAIFYIKKIGETLYDRDVLLVVMMLAAFAGWVTGLWALLSQIALETSAQISVGLGFGIGVPINIWILIVLINRDIGRRGGRRRSLKSITIICAVLLLLVVGITVSAWAVMRFAPLSFSQRVNIAVGLAVSIPLLGLKATSFLQDKGYWWSLLVNVAIFGAVLTPVLWTISTKTHLSRDKKVAITMALGFGVPCISPLLAYGYYRSDSEGRIIRVNPYHQELVKQRRKKRMSYEEREQLRHRELSQGKEIGYWYIDL